MVLNAKSLTDLIWVDGQNNDQQCSYDCNPVAIAVTEGFIQYLLLLTMKDNFLSFVSLERFICVYCLYF